MPSPDYSSYSKLAVEAAKSAGKIAMEYYEKPASSFLIGAKDNPNSIVTKADRECEQCIRDYLSKKAPGTSFLGEEGGHTGSSELLWIIDPIDGTTNFANKVPLFAISIGLAAGTDLLAGAVFNPATGELFSASKGKGALLNGKQIKVAPKCGEGEMIVASDWPHEFPSRKIVSDFIAKQSQKRRYVPVLGTAALSLAWVAAGRFHAYCQPTLHEWDLAAGALLITEAGGRMTRWDNSAWKLGNADTIGSNGYFKV